MRACCDQEKKFDYRSIPTGSVLSMAEVIGVIEDDGVYDLSGWHLAPYSSGQIFDRRRDLLLREGRSEKQPPAVMRIDVARPPSFSLAHSGIFRGDPALLLHRLRMASLLIMC